MDLTALADCVTSASCLVTQTTRLTLIFGVLKIVNFAHGTFYMLGAYVAYTVFQLTGSYTLGVLAGGLGMGIFGIVFERGLIARVYGANVLMQLLICYATVLICDDVVKIVWGADFKAMGMPPAFQVPPLFIAGGVVPPFYVMLITVALVIGGGLGMTLALTKIGKIIRAAAHNPNMVSALGINTTLLYSLVFATGGMLAGLAGGLAAPVRSLTPGMGFSILIESFIVTVIGGMGSIAGALIAAIVLGLIRSFGTIGFPLFTEGLMFIVMIVILVLKPSGLFGKEIV